MTVTAKKYNPGFLTDDQLVTSFCVRQTEFELLVEVLRECTGSSNPHQIVIGPRGSGKTSLLLRVAAEARRDAALAAVLFPLVFAEESYEVATAGEFWLECLTHLAALAAHRKDEPDLHRTVDELRAIRDDRVLGDRCLAALLDFADRRDQRLLLLVENLNMLFRDMADPDAGWRLRKILQTEPRIIVFASATSRFDEIDHPDRALYDLFRVRTLRPLDTDQCAVLWESVCGNRPTPETIRSLEILTGGSPRLISIVARFGAGLSFRDLMSDLFDLVDEHTEYFKSHIESLAAQERRVYLALAALWKPATTREIAEQSRLDTSTCSAQLARLGERGVVQVAGGSARRKQYYLTERLYNIYYLLRRRRGPDRLVQALVHFMEAYYSLPELKAIGIRIAQEVGSLHAEMQKLHWAAFSQLVELPTLAAHRDELLAGISASLASLPGPGPVPAEVAPKAAVSTVESSARVARELFETRVALSNSKPPEDSLEGCNEVVRRFGNSENPAVLEWVAKSFVNKGLALRQLGRLSAALAAWDDLVARFEGGATPALLESVARALVMKAGALAEANRLEDALVVYEEVIHRFGQSQTPVLHDVVAMTFSNKGLVLQRLNRTNDALSVWKEVERRFLESERPAIVEQVAKALVNKGTALLELERPDDALAAWAEVERRFDIGASRNFDEPLATALVNRGAVLSRMNRPEDALAVYDDIIRRFGGSDAPPVLAQVARALFGKGATLDGLNRPEEVLVACDDVLRRFGKGQEPAFFYLVATILVNKGAKLYALHRPEQALAAWDEVVRRFGSSEKSVLLEQVAKALVKKGGALDLLSRPDDALAAYEAVVERCAASGMPALLEQVAQALVNKGALLSRLGRFEGALAVGDEIVRRFGSSESLAFQEQVAKALVNRGAAFAELQRQDEALAVFDEVVRRFGTSREPAMVEAVALALGNKALTLDRMGRPGDALATCHETVRRLEESEVSTLGSLTERALLDKADMEFRGREFDAAVKTVGRMLERRGSASLEYRWRGYLIRAKAALAEGHRSACEHDLKSVLELLPELDSLPREGIEALMDFTVGLGSERVRELIAASPSEALLLPLMTAVEEDLGMELRVAREIKEVAEDVRQDLAELRKHEPMASSSEKVSGEPERGDV